MVYYELRRAFPGILPEIDLPLLRVLIDLIQFDVGKFNLLDRIKRVVELPHIALR